MQIVSLTFVGLNLSVTQAKNQKQARTNVRGLVHM